MRNLFLTLSVIFYFLPGYYFYTEKLIFSTKDKIGSGNYSQFVLHDEGNIKLEVITIEGDADLYLCERVKSCEFSNYNLHSITYGVDEILVNSEMKRPISYSVYAHPYYPQSEFIINKYRLEYPTKSYETHENDDYDTNYFENSKSSKTKRNEDDEEIKTGGSLNVEEYDDTFDENDSIIMKILFHFISFILEIVL